MGLIGLGLGLAIGLTLGLLGAGGSILAVPVFVYILGVDPKSAIVISLGIVGIVSAVGIVPHARAGHVEWRAGLLFAAGSAVGAFAGSAAAALVSGEVQLVVFAVVMFAAAIPMVRGRGIGVESREGKVRRRNDLVRLLVIATLVGTMTGFVGVGGGFMIVPALALLADMPLAQCPGTSLMVISINSMAAFTGYWLKPDVQAAIEGTSIGGTPLLLYSLLFTGIALAGVVGGSLVARRVSASVFRRTFAWFLIVVAVAILAQRILGG